MNSPASNHKSKLIFFGSDAFSVVVLRALLDAGHQVAAVVAQPDRPAGRGRQMQPPAVAERARERGLKLLQPTRLDDITAKLAACQAEAAVVASYGRLIPDSLLGLFQERFINVHPSLLPRYRGAAPIEAAILNGDTETGVSIMQVVPEMDAGDIYGQTRLVLSGTETALELYATLAKLGSELLLELLPQIVAGSLVAKPQDRSAVTLTEKLSKADGLIDWQLPAVQIERQIRAYLVWPGSRTTLAGTGVIVTAARVDEQSGKPGQAFSIDGLPAVHCGQGSLVIQRLKPAGKREMTGQAYLAGHPLN